MKITALVKNEFEKNSVSVSTNDQSQQINITSKSTGYGSSVNGGELLALSLAVCYCNDIYREAAKRQIKVLSVEVTVTGEFGGEGEAGKNFQYKPNILAEASEEEIRELIIHTDKVAEIQKTLRQGIDISLVL